MDRQNLIYNADLSHGNDSWSGNISLVDGAFTATGNIQQNIYIPVSSSRRYRLSCDFRITNNDGKSNFYFALYPYDSSRIAVIDATQVYKTANTDTTLAVDLKAGDTTATVTDATNWRTPSGRVGICDVLAWGTQRASISYPYSSRDNNVINLNSAFTKATIPAGTKVACFYGSNTYYYPWYTTNANLPSEWKPISVEFNGGNTIRYSCQYVRFATLGYNHTYQMKNLRLECISDTQFCNVLEPSANTSINKNGIFYSGEFRSAGAPIRYIRNTVSGNTVNNYGHLNEIKAINDVGENIAWHKKINGEYTDATDGTVNTSYMRIAQNPAIYTLDLEFIENIQKIQIWHYYSDGRTYHDDTVEVSQDGTKWVTVYRGEKPETINGNEIILSPYVASILSTGEVYGHDFYEY